MASDFGLIIVDKTIPAAVSTMPTKPMPCRATVSITTIDKPSVSERSSELIGSWTAAPNKQNQAPMNSAMEANSRWYGGMANIFPEKNGLVALMWATNLREGVI